MRNNEVVRGEAKEDKMEEPKRGRICALNDQFRKTGIGGTILTTQGVQELGQEAVAKIVQAVASYNDFSANNDPYGEHDFGSFEVDGTKLFWKIDYYDLNMEGGSHNPSDPEVTKRVLTIMLRHEY